MLRFARFSNMNPHRIIRDEWPQALARQAAAARYATFVAMPFREHFSYRSREIFSKVIGGAVSEANRLAETKRFFAEPERVDIPMGAAVITEEIVSKILESHLFIADVTFENPGVLLETGIALATKPNRQIILLTQGSHADLHFDLRNNNVLCYSPDAGVERIAQELIAGARFFEEQINHYILRVKERLSPEALIALKFYAERQRHHAAAALHAQEPGPQFEGPIGILRFDSATRELRERDLLYTD